MIIHRDVGGLMQCPNCKTAVLAKSKFCHECGLSLQDAEVQTAARSTTGAHRKLNFDKPELTTSIRRKMEAAQESLAGARRLVTIVFADIQGFTSLCEKLDPEQVTDLMNQYLGRLGGIVYEFEGYIDKFIGDCIMALFGAPIAHENDPELAIRAAMKMLEELKKINLETGHHLNIRIGINSGMVLAGGVGTSQKFEFTVMGDAVNVAQRLQSVAGLNQIIVGQSVAKACSSLFDFEALETQLLKGKSIEVNAFRVQGPKKIAQDPKGIRATPQKLIGRTQELNQLLGLVDALSSENCKNAVLIGEAGSGKSRLKFEVRKHCENSKVKFYDLRPNPLKSEVPYYGLRQFAKNLLTPFLNVGENKKPQLNRLQELGVDSVHQLFLEMLIEIPQDKYKQPELDPNQWKKAVLTSLNLLIHGLAKKEKSFLFIDDAHFLDRQSLEFFWQLKEKQNRFCFVAATRPESMPIPDRLARIELKPLNEGECRELAKTLLKTDQLETDFEKLLIEKSQGIPLFVEELLKAAIDSGNLVHRDGQWKFHAVPGHAALPDSIHSLVLSRVDRLYPSDREVLEVAAVVGRQFTDKIIRRILENRPGIDESLLFLRKKEFIFEVAVQEAQTTYVFNHLLTQEVTYNSILLKRRSVIHKTIGEIIESYLPSQSGSERAKCLEDISYHFGKSEDSRAKAVEHLLAASQERAQLGETEHAFSLLERAKALSDSSPEAAKLKPHISLQHIRLLKDLLRFQEAYQLWSGLSSDESQFQATPQVLIDYYKLSGNLHSALQKETQALGFYQKALDQAEKTHQPHALGELLNDIGVSFLKLGSKDKAKTAFENALQISTQNKHPRLLTKLYQNLGSLHFVSGEFEKAIEQNEKALQLAQEQRNPYQEAMIQHNLGLAFLKTQPVKALPAFEKAQALASSLELARQERAADLYLKYIHWKSEPNLTSEEAMNATLHSLKQKQEWALYTEGVSLFAVELKVRGDTDRARSELTEAIRFLKENSQQEISKRLDFELKQIA